MKIAGLFLLVAGWGIVVSAIVLFPNELPRNSFALAGMALEICGMALLFHAHQHGQEEAE
jgi:hypothetical protein